MSDKRRLEDEGVYTLLGLLGWLINNSTMFQTSKIKHSYTAVSTTTDENIDAVRTKSYIKYFFIMRYQLGLGCQSRDVPDRTGRINTRSDDQAWG